MFRTGTDARARFGASVTGRYTVTPDGMEFANFFHIEIIFCNSLQWLDMRASGALERTPVSRPGNGL